ncbi:tryptophan-rich sensory protein TspO [Palleronia caenipelagi]|uniref:Tryptophan-rich sensory protein n=1 Tax=Palleronia caenipelagi TaxID=2489174 RepID=A0A547Q2R3_9RHOB|nr:TspO/MBR family protein [Palleronia caenipelagi]TRD20687.1 tryptophan-rich sensory protein [Palleronia caenipelagi]
MDWTVFFAFFVASAGAASTGAIFQPGEWYDRLAKPGFTPPNWVFPVVWTVLYIAMAVAAMRVSLLQGSALAIAAYTAQITFNTLWSPVFFGARRIKAGLIVITLLWLSVAATCLLFLRLDLISGLLFVPYVIWVSIAWALNFSIWRLNGDVAPASP